MHVTVAQEPLVDHHGREVGPGHGASVGDIFSGCVDPVPGAVYHG
eukprot:CAMPEP_0181211034 /NCGR_PEP_ID=MMETSP1096-20121128/23566_1 /TAXON_ID=156174 ORGANISM="Chrysochromulina ericina, Strain CCMP281" /NCGR_SAMPLE_ID=MMETSP1096 /ASSEMBLY_ACC=CAM_ASM_000453 /LENGTH=44 /DNA_ID= /DNA_START= /DNA_END= /DNA_ORIENTATION=